MAPFSLSSILGLCISPSGGGEASASNAAAPPLMAAGAPPVATASSSDQPMQSVVPHTQDLQHAQQHLSVEQMHALVLSQHYWPSALAKSDHPQFRLPPPLEDALTEYGTAYTQARAKRSLQWKRSHGLVEITVQLADRAIPVVVTPVHYAVLACFTEGGDGPDGAAPAGTTPRLSLQEVAARLELPEALVRKRISFWVAKGVLREVSAGVFDVQESLSTMESAGVGGGNHLDEDVEHSPGQSGGTRLGGVGGGRDSACAAELEACEPLIQGMLTNYTSLPLARIHHFLQMFMMDPLYTQTETQLRDLLSRLCQKGTLEFNGSNYALVTKA